MRYVVATNSPLDLLIPTILSTADSFKTANVALNGHGQLQQLPEQIFRIAELNPQFAGPQMYAGR